MACHSKWNCAFGSWNRAQETELANSPGDSTNSYLTLLSRDTPIQVDRTCGSNSAYRSEYSGSSIQLSIGLGTDHPVHRFFWLVSDDRIERVSMNGRFRPLFLQVQCPLPHLYQTTGRTIWIAACKVGVRVPPSHRAQRSEGPGLPALQMK